jgi:glycosidase
LIKFRDIALYWTAKGVDGFRYDMAEMVPYEFWSYMNSAVKMKNPDAFLLAEVYNPDEYRNYIRFKMDYLYDKVETYDKLKDIIQENLSPDGLSVIQKG